MRGGIQESLPVICAAALVGASALVGTAAIAAPKNPDARAAAVEAKMSDDERFQLLHTVPRRSPAIGAYVPGIPRLGVPPMLQTGAALGVAKANQKVQATALPSGLAIAATFDPDLAYAAGRMVGAEARALGYNLVGGGEVNLARDPRNGRNFEYLGEDPLLSGTMGGEAVRGTQSQGVISTAKHFVLNDQETLRQTLDARIDEAALRESDLLAFEIAIERGQPGAVMCSYNLVNGAYACGNDHLLNGVLKGDWGFKGWVISDAGATHDVSYFIAGLDQELGAQIDAKVWFDQPLRAEYAAGQVSKARLSDAVRRILRSIYAVGADRPSTRAPIDIGADAEIAQKVAESGIVLLKNDGVLPLAGVKSILVVGGNADIGVMSGGGSSQVLPIGGAAAIIPLGGTGPMARIFGRQLIVPSSPLKALQAALPRTIRIEYDSGYEPSVAAARAAKADAAIVFATQWQSEGFDNGMTLPEGQDALIEAVAAANPDTIVVLETGNPVKMPWLDRVKSIVEAWYPGQKGGDAIAAILTGKVNPSGRLPVSWPVDERQTPRPAIAGLGAPAGTKIEVKYDEGANVGYRWFKASHQTPLFPFGHGLSYTRFEYSPLKVIGGKRLAAIFTVQNTGDREGADVPQIYLTSAGGRPLLRLAAFSKVALRPGEKRILTLPIDRRLLAHWDTPKNRWQIAPGDYQFALGESAGTLLRYGSVRLAAAQLKP